MNIPSELIESSAANMSTAEYTLSEMHDCWTKDVMELVAFHLRESPEEINCLGGTSRKWAEVVLTTKHVLRLEVVTMRRDGLKSCLGSDRMNYVRNRSLDGSSRSSEADNLLANELSMEFIRNVEHPCEHSEEDLLRVFSINLVAGMPVDQLIWYNPSDCGRKCLSPLRTPSGKFECNTYTRTEKEN